MSTEQTLEDVLMQVERLRGDLSAVIVIKEEEIIDGGTWHDVISYTWGYYGPDVIIPRVTEPDTPKQESARQQLQEVYDSSEWYTARYWAGRYLGIKDENISQNMEIWLKSLRERAWLPRNSIELTPAGEPDWEGYISTPPGIIKTPIPENIESSRNAIKDIAKLFLFSNSPKAREILEKIYKTRETLSSLFTYDYDKEKGNFNNKELTEIGKALGYSSLRIWAHEHPITAMVGNIAIVGCIASGLGYLIYQYLTR